MKPEYGAFDGVAEIEEPVIDLVETMARSWDLSPEEMSKLARGGSLDANFGLSWTQILWPYIVHGIPQDPDGRAGWEAVRSVFRQTFMPEWSAFAMANAADATKFLYMRAMVLKNRRRAFWMWSPVAMVCRLFEPGSFGYIHGPPGSGKTFCAGLFMQHQERTWAEHVRLRESRLEHTSSVSTALAYLHHQEERLRPRGEEAEVVPETDLDFLHARELRFVTNIRVGPGHPVSPLVDPCHRLTDFLIHTSRNFNEGRASSVYFDEYAAHSDQGRNTKEKQTLEYVARTLIRKARANMTWLSQGERDVPQYLLDWVNTDVEFPESSRQGEGIFTVRGVYKREKIPDMPKTTVPVQTTSRGSVIIDLYDDDIQAITGEAESRCLGLDEATTARKVNEALIEACLSIQRRDLESRGAGRRGKKERAGLEDGWS